MEVLITHSVNQKSNTKKKFAQKNKFFSINSKFNPQYQ